MSVSQSYFSLLLIISWLNPAFPASSSNINQKKTGNQPVETFLFRCDSFLMLGNAREGKKMLDSTTAFLPIEKSDHLLQFRYYAQRGRYLRFTGESEKAFYSYQRALKHGPFIPETYSGELARLHGDIAALNYSMKDYSGAVRSYRLALSTQALVSPQNSIKTIYYRACLMNACSNNSQTEEASTMNDTCTAFLDRNKYPLNKDLLDVYFELVDYYFSTSKMELRFEKYLNLATHILQREYPPDHFKYGILFYYKGCIDYSKHNAEKALHFFNRSLQIVTRFPSLRAYQYYDYYYIASIYCYHKQDYLMTIQYCQQVMGKVQEIGYTPEDFYYLLGVAHKYSKHLNLSQQYYWKAISLSSSLNKTDASIIKSLAYYQLSRFYSYNNRPDQMVFYLEKALKAARENSTKNKRVSDINMNLAWLYYFTGEYKKSLACSQQSIISSCDLFSDTSVIKNPASTDVKPYYSLIEALTTKANSLVKASPGNLKYLESALNCQELAVQLIEQGVINMDEEESELILVDDRKRAMNNAVSYATSLYLKTGKRMYAEKALSYAEKSKMQVLLINTEKKNQLSRAGVPDSLIRKGEKLNNRILDLENQIALMDRKGQGGTNNNLIVSLTGIYDQHDELNLRIMEDYPAFNESRYDIQIAGLGKIRRMLSGEQIILEYQLLLSELYTFVISKDTFYVTHQRFDGQFHEHIRQLRDMISCNGSGLKADSVFKVFSTSSHYLYRYLIGPEYDRIKGKRLIIIPHNELTQIPFEVLISRMPGDGSRPDYRSLSYMIREFPMAYAYSANFLVDQEAGKKVGSGTAIFLPDYSTYGGRDESYRFRLLEGAAREASTIRKFTRGKLFNGRLAEETSFKKNAARYGILHIASHTVVDEKQPSLSCLVMTAPSDSTDDGFLHAYELRQMKLNAQLVVLSGCNTGFGKLRFSEGLVSLARSFFYTGVRTVAFTLWPVADKAGSDLVCLFYEGLGHRQTLDVALRNAKLTFLDHADPVKAHPFYWANYIVVGRTDEVPSRKFPLRPLTLLGSVLAIIMAVFLYRKFKT